MRDIEIEEALARVPFFADLSRRDLRRLAGLSVPKRFVTGDEIVTEGAVGLGLFLLTEGKVDVFKSEDGRRRRLAELGPGQFLGEMALIDDKPRSASAVALEPTTTLLLSRDSFRTVVRKSPAVAWALVPEIADRLRDVENRLVAAEARADRADARYDDEDQDTDELLGENGRAEAASEPLRQVTRGLIQAPAALARCGLAGFSGSLRVLEAFVKTFADTLSPAQEKALVHVVAQLPLGIWNATADSAAQAWKLPQAMFDEIVRSMNGGSG